MTTWNFDLCFKCKTVKQSVHCELQYFCLVSAIFKWKWNVKYICFTLWFWLKKVLLFRGGECYKWPSLGYNTAPLLSSDKWIDVYHPMSYKGSWFYYFLIILPFCTCSQTQSSLWWKQGVQTRYFEASRELNSNLSSATQQLAGLGCIAGSPLVLLQNANTAWRQSHGN